MVIVDFFLFCLASLASGCRLVLRVFLIKVKMEQVIVQPAYSAALERD
jgi:hypothetical protein